MDSEFLQKPINLYLSAEHDCSYLPDRLANSLFVDPDTVGNYYRIFTKVLGKDSIFHHPFASVAEDQIINGQEVEYSTYYNPPQTFEEEQQEPVPDEPPDFYFKNGETVVLKLCSITADHYYFWKTIEQLMMSGGNPFSSPTTVRTNINGNGLGIWGSYGAAMDTIVINSSVSNKR